VTGEDSEGGLLLVRVVGGMEWIWWVCGMGEPMFMRFRAVYCGAGRWYGR